MEIQYPNQVFQKDKNKRTRPKSAFVTSVYSHDKQINQFSTNMFVQIGNHLNIGCQQKVDQNGCKNLQDEQQPPSSGIKWKASKVKTKEECKKSSKLVPQRKLKNFERISFGSKFQKFQNQSLHCMKFPSQKTLLSKEKVLPIKRPEKQKYVVEICRIFKQNCNTIFAENSKENQAFVTHQVQKYRQIKTDSKNKNPIVTFNYDGSILMVHPLKKTGAQTIQCTGQQSVEAIIKPLHVSHQTHKGQNQKEEDPKNYGQLQKVSSKYIDNFKNISWSPKITVINQQDSQLNPSKLYKKNNENAHENDNLFDVGQWRSRANTVKLKKQNEDQKSIIRIQNHQAYKQQLMINKTQKCVNYRSVSYDFSDEYPKSNPRDKTDENFYRKKSKVHQKQFLDLPKKDKKGSQAKKRSFHIPAPKDDSRININNNKNQSNQSLTRIHNGKMIDCQSNYHVQVVKGNFLTLNAQPSNFVRSKSAHVKHRKNNEINESLAQTSAENAKECNQSQMDTFQTYIRKQQSKTNKTVQQILKKFQNQKTPSNQGNNIKKLRAHARATTKLYH